MLHLPEITPAALAVVGLPSVPSDPPTLDNVADAVRLSHKLLTAYASTLGLVCSNGRSADTNRPAGGQSNHFRRYRQWRSLL